MSIEQPGLPPAGWYPDPTGKPVQRWWDSQAWTAHERLPEAPPVAPQPSAPAPVAPVQHAPVQHAPVQHAPVQHAIAPQAPAQQPVAPLAPAQHSTAQHALSAAPAAQAVAYTPPSVPQPAAQVAPQPVMPSYPTQPATPAYAAQPIAQPVVEAPVAPVVQAPVAQPQVAAPPVRQAPQPAASAFAPEAAAQPMFPAPISAVSVQSPTTAAFEFSFSSPDDLGVNGRARAFRSTAASPVVETGAAVQEAEAVAPARVRSKRRAAPIELDEAPSGWSTSSVWLLVLMPILRGVFLAGAIYSLLTLDVGYLSAAAIAAVPYLITILVAMSDRRRLQAKGFDKPAHWAWSLAGEWLYLIVRSVATRREVAGGGIVVWLWVLSLVLVAGGAYYYLSITSLPLVELVIG